MIREREREMSIIKFIVGFFIILIMFKFLMVVVFKMLELLIVWFVIDFSYFFFFIYFKGNISWNFKVWNF